MNKGKRIEENNKIFAEFMGFTPDDFGGRPGFYDPEQHCTSDLGSLCFDHDWNQLMRVVDKIESMKDEHGGNFKFYIQEENAIIKSCYDEYIVDKIGDEGKFKVVYDTALEFIKNRKEK